MESELVEVELLENEMRSKLNAVWLRYQRDRNPVEKQEYLKLLRQFSDLIISGRRPPTHEE